MTIMRWDPFKNISTLQDRINRLFEDAFPRSSQPDEACDWRPAVDIYEDESGIVILVDLPGVEKEDVGVEAKENMLTLKGLRKIEPPAKEDQYYRRERGCGAFHRVFTIRYPLAPEKIKASFKNGVLKIEIPKPDVEKPRTVTVNID
jgi:HSP20 family protein